MHQRFLYGSELLPTSTLIVFREAMAIFTGQKLNSVQEYWMLLIFLIRLHNRLTSIRFIVLYKRLQLFKQGPLTNNQEQSVWFFATT